MSSNTLVGITSGPGCDGTAANYGYFVKLADKVRSFLLVRGRQHSVMLAIDSRL
jgi:hypothetical protein